MTRKEAIAILNGDNLNRCSKKENEALEMAIQALQQEPTVEDMEREYEKSKALFHKIVECDDAVSREAVLMIANSPTLSINETVAMIKRLPSVMQKSGHWNTYENYQGGIKETWYECSECKWSSALLIPRKYCPNCGADMKG